MLRPLTCWWLAAFAAAAGAQPAAPPPQPLPYRSALEGYRPLAEQPVAPWKEANDNVGRIGGWKAYAREASGLAPAATPAAPASPAREATSAASPAAMPSGHGGHHQHHGPAK